MQLNPNTSTLSAVVVSIIDKESGGGGGGDAGLRATTMSSADSDGINCFGGAAAGGNQNKLTDGDAVYAFYV